MSSKWHISVLYTDFLSSLTIEQSVYIVLVENLSGGGNF